MHLDVQTVGILYVCVLIVSASQLVIASRINQDSLILSRAAMGLVTGCLGFPLLATRGVAPDFVSFTVANGMLLLSGVFLADAVRANNEEPFFSKKFVLLLLLVHTPLLNYFVYVDLSHAGRALINYPIHIFLNAICAYWLLSRFKTRSFAERFLGSVFLLNTLFNCGMFPVDLMKAQGYDGVNNSTRTDLITLFYMVITLLWTYGFINLANSRLVNSLARMADFDDLTGCLNRRAFYDRIERSWTRPDVSSFACLIIDIDHFKRINDAHGHYAGDKVLSTFGELLHDTMRPGDTVGRLGGEEFGVFLTNVPLDQVEQISERFRAKVEDLAIDVGEQEPLHITISIGICLDSSPRNADGISYYFAKADQALYAAKEQGRNRVINWASL